VLYPLRVTGLAALMMLKILFRARVVVVAVVVQPIVFAAIAGLVLGQGPGGRLSLSAAVGVAMMGGWTSILFFGGGLLTRERRQGTLELLVASPAPLLAVMLGACLATALLVCYSLVSTVVVGVLFFHTPFDVASPGWLVVGLVVSVSVLAVFGVMLSALFALYREATMFQNVLEYPVWIASGLLVPLAALPGPVRVIGRILPSTWAFQSLSRAVTGAPSEGRAVLLCVLLGAGYLVIGGALLALAERRARVLATLSLS
jgi:ABC-2 type transport system permease protein